MGIMPGLFTRSRHNAFIIFSITAVIVNMLLFFPAVKALTVTDFAEDRLLLCRKLNGMDWFSIRYIHSVNKSPVEDFFIIEDDGGIRLDKSVFYSFGAGVPSDSADGGVFHVYHDRIEVTGINRRIDNFLLFVGVTAEHRFRMNGEDILLRGIVEPQRNIRFSVERVSMFNLLLH